jgi:stage III sporulation protein AA
MRGTGYLLVCRNERNFIDPLEQVLAYISPRLREVIEAFADLYPGKIQEIRLRQDRPVIIETEKKWMVKSDGVSTVHPQRAVWTQIEDIKKTMELLTESSIYTMEEELRQGFITLPGGHRAGLAGECLVCEGRMRRIKTVASINLRIAREIVGIGRNLLPYLWNGQRFCRTIVISPPRAGKTTLLRDLIRAVSDGEHQGVCKTVGLVDERSEIAGCYQGNPQLDIGLHTDVLDGCPKNEGIYLLLRTMSPEVVAVDELGGVCEAEAIRDLLRAGVSVLATAHAENIDELKSRPVLAELFRCGNFERVVVLSRRLGIGTLEEIWNEQEGRVLMQGPILLEGGLS